MIKESDNQISSKYYLINIPDSYSDRVSHSQCRDLSTTTGGSRG